ncbi:MAG: hypothetical protein JXA41_15545 [Deltaproteobacteria bacterium]|nr:hypothetical protein [Deltaproteobacteria bacterium]
MTDVLFVKRESELIIIQWILMVIDVQASIAFAVIIFEETTKWIKNLVMDSFPASLSQVPERDPFCKS